LNWVFVGRHISSSSINITCNAISKFICAFIPQFNFAQTSLVKNIRKGFSTSNPKKPKYPTIWNPDVLIDYYYKNNGDELPLEQKYRFLQTKIAILLGYLHMLGSEEEWSCEITDKSKLGVDFNKGLWLRTIIKNKSI
jgi:hypothetical protein